MKARPSNILIKVVMAIVALIACYAVGGIMLQVLKANKQNSIESSDMNIDCNTLANNRHCISNFVTAHPLMYSLYR